MASLRIKRGTLAQLQAAAAANQLKQGEQYLVTDYGRVAVGLSVSSYRIEVRVYTQATAPTGALAGDIWIQTP